MQSARGKASTASGQIFERNTYNAFYNNIIADWRFERNICTGGYVSSIPDNGPLGIITLYGQSNLTCASTNDTPVSNSGTLSFGGSAQIFYATDINNPAMSNNPTLKSITQNKIAISFWLKLTGSNADLFAYQDANHDTIKI